MCARGSGLTFGLTISWGIFVVRAVGRVKCPTLCFESLHRRDDHQGLVGHRRVSCRKGYPSDGLCYAPLSFLQRFLSGVNVGPRGSLTRVR